MASPDYGSLIAQDQRDAAQNNLASASGVAPDAAAAAIKTAPTTGVPATTGMYTPDVVNDMADRTIRSSILNASPSLQQFVAKSPAHAAATQDSFDSLLNVGHSVLNLWKGAGYVYRDTFQQGQADFTAPIEGAISQVHKDYLGTISGKPTTPFDLGTIPHLVGVPLSVLGGVANLGIGPLSRSAAELAPGYTSPNFSDVVKGFQGQPFQPRQRTFEEAQQLYSRQLGLATLALGAARGAGIAGETEALGGAEAAGAPHGPPEPTPGGGWNVNDAGHVADAQGNPVVFNSAKDAAKWILREGYATDHPQIFEPAVGPEGGFVVRQSGLREGPQTLSLPSPEQAEMQVQQADFAAQALRESEGAVAESKVQERTPGLMEEWIDQHAGDKSVLVPADGLLSVISEGGHPMPEFGYSAEQILDAASRGDSLEVPTGKYLTEVSGKPYADQLRELVSLSPNGLSQADAQAALEHETAKAAATQGVETAATPEQVLAQEDTTKRQIGQILEQAKVPEEGAASSVRQSVAAVRSQIRRLFQSQYLMRLFSEPTAAGMSPDQFARYSMKVEDAVDKATARVIKKAYDAVKKERTPEWKAAHAQHLAAAEQQTWSAPIVQLQHALLYNEHPNGAPLESPPLKMDKAAVARDYGQGVMDFLPPKMFGRNGVHPDEIAPYFGYDSGEAMLNHLLTYQGENNAAGVNAKQFVKQMSNLLADTATKAELGYDISAQALDDAARAMAKMPEVTDLLTDELKALAQTAGLPLDVNAVEAHAREMFERMNVTKASQIKSAERAVMRSGKQAEMALLKGDPVQAFLAKQQQLLNQHILAMSHDLAREMGKAAKRNARWARNPVLKGQDQETLNYLRAILDSVGFPVRTGKFEGVAEALKGKTLSTFVEEKRQLGYEPVHADIPAGKSLSDMTVYEWNGVNDMLKSLATIGRDKFKVEAAGEKAELADIVQQIKEGATEVGRKYTAGEIRSARDTIAAKVGKGTRTLGTAVARPEVYLNWLDGEKFGPLMKYVVDVLQQGKHTEGDLMRTLSTDFREFMKGQPKAWGKTLNKRIDVPELLFSYDATGTPTKWIQFKKDAIMLALNMGTESNIAKIEEGFGWDRAEIYKVLDRVLAPEDMKYVQFLLDQHSKLWPKIVEHSRKVTGLAPAKLDAVPIPHASGEYAGGYWPVTYDRTAVGAQLDQFGNHIEVVDPTQLSADSMFGADYRPATPSNRYTLARTNFKAPIALNYETLHLGFDQVIHDLAYRVPLMQAAKVLGHPDVSQAIQEVLGPEYVKESRNWLQYIARQRVYDGAMLESFANLIRQFRHNFTMVQIGFNLSTTIKHSGIAASHITTEVGLKQFGQAVADLTKTPAEAEYWKNFVLENSGEVRNIMLNLDRDIREAFESQVQKSGFVDGIRYNAFILFSLAKQIEAMPTWLAKYRTLLDAGETHDGARFGADKAVRDTQGAGGLPDLPALWRGGEGFWGEVGKLTNLFTGFLNTTTNREWTMVRTGPRMVRGFKEGDWAGAKRDWNKISANSLGFIIIPALFATTYEEATKGDFRHFLGHALSNLTKGTIGSLPGGEAVADLPRLIKTKGADLGTSPIVQSFGEAFDTANNAFLAGEGKAEKISSRWVQHAIDTVGYITGTPVKPLSNAGQYWWDWDHNKVGRKSWLEAVRGTLFGTKPKSARR